MTVSRHRCRIGFVIGLLATGSVVAQSSGPGAEAADVGPIGVVPVDVGDDNLIEVVDATTDGGRLLVSSATDGRWVGDASSDQTFGPFSFDSVLSPVGSSVLDPNDSADGGTITDLRTGETTNVAFDDLLGGDGRTVAVPPAPFRMSGGDGGRIVAADIPPDGSINRRIGIVVDVETDELLTPGDDGVSVTNSNNSSIESVSPDGDEIVYREFSSAGAQPSRWVRWTRSTDTREVIEPPVEHQAGDGEWTVSSDLRWVTFVSGDDLTVRDLQSADDFVVPVVYSELEPSNGVPYRLTVDGQIVFLRDAPTSTFGQQPQLFVWAPGDAEATQVTVGRGGAEPAAPTEDVEVSGDGTVVAFTSFADNLVDGTVGLERRVFQVDIADRPAAGAAVRLMDTREGVGGPTLAPGVERCVAVPQAVPGEFVVVNVTPVRGSARGFGVVHSSDVPAGETANVNYSVGSIDPNVAVSQVGADGELCFTNSSAGSPSVDVIIDQLLTAPATTFRSSSDAGAVRLLDTRDGGTALAPGEERCVATGPSGGPPVLGGEFVVVNLTPVRATARGFGSMYSSDVAAGETSNVNYDVGSIDPNVAIAAAGEDGRVCFTNSTAGDPTVDLVADQLLAAPSGVFRVPGT